MDCLVQLARAGPVASQMHLASELVEAKPASEARLAS